MLRHRTPALSPWSGRHSCCTATTHDGLTLIELLLALAIVGVLAAIALPSYERYREKVNDAQATADIRTIELAITSYGVSHNDALPATLADVGKAGMLDPWGHAYVYQTVAAATGNGTLRKDRNLVPLNTDYDLYSKGADGRSQSPLTAQASRDDIVRANNGGFVGLASDY